MNLTTGQMLDQLGIEDTATNQEGYKVGYNHKGNLLFWGPGEEKPQVAEGNTFSVYYPFFKRDRWEINYHFVDFEEARYAHTNENKTIILFYTKEKQYKFVPGEDGHFIEMANDDIGFDDLVKGKWIIKN